MEPTENRPARRLTEEELVAALRHILPIEKVEEVYGHHSLDTLLSYRREVNKATPNAARKLLALDDARESQTPEQIAEITGHRSDTAQLYLEMRDAFRSTDPDIDEE